MATIERTPRKTGALALPVIGVTGRSGSGKTTLLELLIPRLIARGLAVGAVKHTSHGFLADRPGKDSYRLYEVGAASVALISRQQLAIFTRRSDAEAGPDVLLETALASLPGDLDVVLVEGFSWEPIPRFVLIPVSESPIPEHLSRGEVLGILRVAPAPEGSKPRFRPAMIEAVVSEIELRVRPGGAKFPPDAGGGGSEADLATGGG